MKEKANHRQYQHHQMPLAGKIHTTPERRSGTATMARTGGNAKCAGRYPRRSNHDNAAEVGAKTHGQRHGLQYGDGKVLEYLGGR